MKFASLFMQGIGRLLLTILSADLLYLYYDGAWYDPFKWIEITEVILLYVITVAGIYWTIKFFLNICREGLKQ